MRNRATLGTAWLTCGLVLAGTAALRASDPASTDRTVEAYLAANGFLHRGLNDLAVKQYREFLDKNPGHEKASPARYGLGVALFRLEKYDEALEPLAAVAALPDFEFAAEAGLLSGQCQLHAGKFAAAAISFSKVLAAYPEHAVADDAAAGMIEALYLEGRYTEARARGEPFDDSYPGSPLRDRVLFFRGLSARAVGDLEAASACFGELASRSPEGLYGEQAMLLSAQCQLSRRAWDSAESAFRAVLERKNGRSSTDAMLGLGQVLRAKGKPEEAGAILDQLLARESVGPLVPFARFERALAWFDLGQYERAMEALRRIPTEEKDFADDAAYWKGKCQLRLGKTADAARTLEEARSKFPESDLQPDMVYDLAVARIRLNEHDEAFSLLSGLDGRRDGNRAADVLHLLAVAEHQRRNFDASTAFCRRFLDGHEGHSQFGSVLFLIAENEFLSGRYTDAVPAYGRFLARKPDADDRVRAEFRMGIALYHLERYEEAERWLSAAVTAGRDSSGFEAALLALGDIRFQRGEWKQAEELLRAYVSGGSTRPLADDALLKLGLCALRQGRTAEALRSFEQLLERFRESPHRLQAKFERGQALASLGKQEEASVAFREVLAEDTERRFTSLVENHLGSIALSRKNYEEAAERFERAMNSGEPVGGDILLGRARALLAGQRYEEAEQEFRRFLDAFPSHAAAAEARAQLALSVARQDRYEDTLVLLAQTEVEFGKLNSDLQRSLLREKAWCLKKLNRSDEAAAIYRTLLEPGQESDSDAHALLELAEIEANSGRPAEAVALLRRMLRQLEGRRDESARILREHGLYRLGVCEFQTEQFAEAAASFEELLKAYPETSVRASAAYLCGESWYRLGRMESAAGQLSRVVENYAGGATFGPALLRLGEVQAALQRWSRSEKAFSDYLDRFPEGEQRYQAQFGVGWAREHLGRLDEAIDAYRNVLVSHQGPTAARAQFQIGECLFAKQQYQESVTELLKVDILYAYPEWSAAALYEAGRCFQKMGKPQEARDQFRMVIEQHGSTRWAEMASRELSAMSGEGRADGAAGATRSGS